MPLKEILLKYWGYSKFRPLQEEIITSVINGNDTLALLPTGGGKSICFQVPALYKQGICLVISPLIALMKDQVENLNKKGIRANAIYSGMHFREIENILNNCVFGDIKLLYLSPERLKNEMVIEHIKQMDVNLLAVDEAHCISQWGYDFRPSYLDIAIIRTYLPKAPVLALTATATSKVVDDIQSKLLFSKSNIFQKTFERKNLTYFVVNTEDKNARLLRIIEKNKGSAIVYVRNRKKVIETSIYLNKNGIKAGFYHAGLDTKVRNEQQNLWMQNKNTVMVATNAFGMGIDKPDVRVVVHIDLPNSLEAYFQEAGRAGRDEKKSFSVILFNQSDILNLEQNFQTSYPDKETIKQIYNALGNFFGIPLGAGKDINFPFDLKEFCGNYNLNSLITYNSLKFLEKDAYILLNEDPLLTSKIMIIVDKEELYRFQVANSKLDNFIKLILRSYGGVFNDFIKISEIELANRVGENVNKVIENLIKLDNSGIINYIPAINKPFITFIQNRLDPKDILLNKDTYDIRKKNSEARKNSVITYVQSTAKCRSLSLLSYFGEENAKRCGSCDICIYRNKMELTELEFNSIIEVIKPMLLKKSYSLEEIVKKVNADEDNVLKVIQWLLDNDKIVKTGVYEFMWKSEK